MWRSALFIPATEPRFLEKAATRGAEAIVLDLEAGVVAHRKAEARTAVAAAVERLSAADLDIAVRINTGWRAAFLDVEAAALEDVSVIIVPDVRNPDILVALDGHLGELEADRRRQAPPIGLLPIIESAAGVENAARISAAPRVVAAAFGVEDFAADMRATPSPAFLDHVAYRLATAIRAAGRTPLVIPQSLAHLDDLEGFAAAAERARACGTEGGFAIHPKQVKLLNACFSPTSAEIQHAERVLAAAEEAGRSGKGAFLLDGRMVDLPIVLRARRLLERADRDRA